MENVLISIVVPVYKCEKNLIPCIESLLAQSHRNLQLILVDDGSPDQSPQICDAYAERDSRIRVIHKENGGVSSARNTGIEVAEGTYITFVDSDDYLDRDFLKDLLSAAQQHQADLTVSGLTMEQWQNGQITDSTVYAFAEERLYDTRELLEAWNVAYPPICMCGPWCKLYRREPIEQWKIRFLPDLHCGEDTLFNLEYLEKCDRIFVLPACYYHYRRENGESLFSRFHPDTYEIHFLVYGKKRQVMQQVRCSQTAIEAFERDYFALLLGGIHEYFRFCDRTTFRQKRELVKRIASDPYVKKLPVSKALGIKNSFMLMLMKLGMYNVILGIFRLHYRKRL